MGSSAGEIILAGLAGGGSAYFKNNIKENDEAKVQDETERRERLLLEKEKRIEALNEKNTLRARGWQETDLEKKNTRDDTIRQEELVYNALKDSENKKFTIQQRELAQKHAEALAETGYKKEDLREERAIRKELARAEKEKLKDQQSAASDVEKEFARFKTANSESTMSIHDFAKTYMAGTYAKSGMSAASGSIDPADVVMGNITPDKQKNTFGKNSANPEQQTGKQGQLPTMSSHSTPTTQPTAQQQPGAVVQPRPLEDRVVLPMKPKINIGEIQAQLIRDPTAIDIGFIVSQMKEGILDVSKLSLGSLENLHGILSKQYDRDSTTATSVANETSGCFSP